MHAGMGIDKPNIRTIIHAGTPSSLEAYYQQAGRAGRDGGAARCALFWSSGDLSTLDNIKGAAGLSAQGKAAYEAGVTHMQVRGLGCVPWPWCCAGVLHTAHYM